MMLTRKAEMEMKINPDSYRPCSTWIANNFFGFLTNWHHFYLNKLNQKVYGNNNKRIH